MESEKKLRLNRKTFFLTYPQCSLDPECVLDWMLKKGGEQIVVGREKHQDGNLHLHVFVQFEKKKNLKRADYFDIKGFHPNIGQDKSFGNKDEKQSKKDMIAYVIKGGDYVEWGIDAKAYIKASENHTALLCKKLIRDEITLTQFVEQQPDMLLQLGKVEKNLKLYQNLKVMEKAITKDGFIKRESYWIWGTPRIGKSFYVRRKYPQCYLKGFNKWWDGYTVQEVVLLEEFDSDFLAHHLKIWTDNYLFNAEIKGGTVTPIYQKFFITSNETIEQVFGEGGRNEYKSDIKTKNLIQALNARMFVIHGDDFMESGYFSMEKWIKKTFVDDLISSIITISINC